MGGCLGCELDQTIEPVMGQSNSPPNESEPTRSCQQCEQLKKENQRRFTDKELFYKKKLGELRSILKQTEEELETLKESMAADVVLSIKTEDTESLNSPVSKTRLRETYEKFRLVQWPKVKDQLRSTEMKPETTKDLIQKIFDKATEEMKKKKKEIEDIFVLTESDSGLTPQKVKQFQTLAIQNHQLSLYHTRKEGLILSLLPDLQPQCSAEVAVILTPVLSECFWIGCLLALNSPPLQPDWDSHVQSMDHWAIFPPDFKSSSW